MKNILFKYGILPNILGKDETELFQASIKEASSGRLDSFYEFLNKISDAADKTSKSLRSVKESAVMLATQALEALERASSRPESTMLSAFSEQVDGGSLELTHTLLVTSLWQILSSLELASFRCAEAIDAADDALVCEYKLRLAALLEFSNDAELRTAYLQCQRSAESLSREETASRYLEAEKKISLLYDTVKRLCTDADFAFDAIVNLGESRRAYDRTVLQYADVIGTLLANLKEV